MKNLIIVLAVAFALAIAGCASQSQEKPASVPTSVKTETANETPAEASSGSIDLAVNNMTLRSADWAATYSVTISPIIRNLGDAVSDVEVGLYANDDLLKTFVLDFSKGEMKSFLFDWYPEEPGRYDIKVIIDPAHKTKDSNRENNQFSYSVRIS